LLIGIEHDVLHSMISFAYDFGKWGLVLIITSETELEISRPLCKGFL